MEQKNTIRNQPQIETHNEPENEITELQSVHKPTTGTIDNRKGHFRDIAKFRLEQNIDPVLRNLRAKIEGEPFDESAFTQDNATNITYILYSPSHSCTKILP